MSTKNIKIIEGIVERDPFGSWSDCSPGLYLDGEKVDVIFNEYKNEKIKVTIEIIEEEKKS